MNLKAIFEPVSNELQMVKQQLRRQLDTFYTDRELNDIQKKHVITVMDHFFHKPGKGLRPALGLLAAKVAGSSEEANPLPHAVIRFATVVELFHSASLVHDDIIDLAQSRRGQESLNGKYGDHIAVVVGDGLILEAFSLLFTLESSKSQKEQVFQIMYRTLQKMCLGGLCEHRLLTKQDTADVNEYVGVLDKKTASLMSACCECSAILLGNDPESCQQMASFGTNFGIAFQVADDLKDRDALLEKGVDLAPIVQTYAQKAKDDLSPFHDIPAKRSLMALCGMLLPTPHAPGMFDRHPVEDSS
ncbi:MAG: polyprenyl synthetase family protein [bacterium]|nr:polyprenyl synthetase family protein [bacterium]